MRNKILWFAYPIINSIKIKIKILPIVHYLIILFIYDTTAV